MTNNNKMTHKLRILSSDEAMGFYAMTFPAYRKILGGASVAIGAWHEDEPTGMALYGPTANSSQAELLSLFVTPPHRRNGLGTQLMTLGENSLTSAGLDCIRTTWSETMSGTPAFMRVLAKCNWSKPKRRMLVLRGEIDGVFGQGIRQRGPKYESPACLPRQYTLSTWSKMTSQDYDFILSKQGQPNWYAAHANPFRDKEILDTSISQILKKDGEIVGWLTMHRTAPDTVRFTDVFIREDLKRAGAVAIGMVTHGFWLLMAHGVSKLTWAIEDENEPLIRMCQTRLGDISNLSWTWGAQKTISQ